MEIQQHGSAPGGPIGGLIASLVGVSLGWSFPDGTVDTVFLAAVGGAVGWLTQQVLKYVTKKIKGRKVDNKGQSDE